MEKKNDFDWNSVLMAFGLGVPIFLMFAPRNIQKDLVEYLGKFLFASVLIAAGVAFIRDKKKKKRIQEEKKHLEKLQRENRERAERYRRERLEKEKREG